MIRNATVRELSLVTSVCRFFGFLIYNSVRFVYISFTFPLNLLFLFLLAKIHGPDILTNTLRHEWHLIGFKRFFLAKTLAKTCSNCHKNGKSLIFKRIFYCQMRHELIKKCSSSNYYNVALLHAHAMLLYKATLQCYKQCNATVLQAMQRYSATSNATLQCYKQCNATVLQAMQRYYVKRYKTIVYKLF